MEKDIYQSQQNMKYHGVSNVPFPHASPSPKLLEEQAFYDANSGDNLRRIIRLLQMLSRLSKRLKGK